MALVTFNLHVIGVPALLQAIDELRAEIRQLRREGRVMSNAMGEKIQELVSKVQELVTVNDSVEALLVQLHDMLVDAQGDPAAVQAVIDMLEEQRAELAQAVVDNTPAT